MLLIAVKYSELNNNVIFFRRLELISSTPLKIRGINTGPCTVIWTVSNSAPQARVIAPNNTPFRHQFFIEMGRCAETRHSLPSLPAMSYSLPSRPSPPMRRQTYSPSPPSSIRRPLRSSPLTGPSLNVTSDGIISELSLAPRSMTSPKPSRISSTPDLPSLTFTPIKVPKRTSAPTATPSFKSTLPSPPPSPSHRPKSRDSCLSMSPSQEYGPLFPRAYTGARSLPTSPNASRFSLVDDSWFTANPYGSTPKFSRLSMDSKAVVMPVSAKERRRMSTVPTPSKVIAIADSGTSHQFRLRKIRQKY